jgi:glycosyltransferase involved in cell wall biosynthesis
LALKDADIVVEPLDKVETNLPTSGASAFIFPSIYEGFGIQPLEEMSHDCPVGCRETSAIPEGVGDASEYFHSADSKSMGAAIERVVTSDGHWKLLIWKGRARLKYFFWDCCIVETFDIFMKLT